MKSTVLSSMGIAGLLIPLTLLICPVGLSASSVYEAVDDFSIDSSELPFQGDFALKSLYFDAGNIILGTKSGDLTYVHEFTRNGDYLGSRQSRLGWLSRVEAMDEYYYGTERDTVYLLDGNSYVSLAKSDLSVSFARSLREQSLVLVEGDVFIWDNDGKVYCFEDVFENGLNRSNILDADEARELINTDPRFREYELDEKDRLFRGGILVSRDYRQFLRYFAETVDYNDRKANRYLPFHSEQSSDFVGRDQDGNWYWRVLNEIIVFSSSGYVLDRFEYGSPSRFTLPVVSPRGDVFFAHKVEGTIVVQHISPQW